MGTLSERFTARQRQLLENRRLELLLRMRETEQQSKGSRNNAEQANALTLRLEGLRHEARYLFHVLSRLADGTYATCSACTRPIERRRLRARPETTVCSRCASARRPHPGGTL